MLKRLFGFDRERKYIKTEIFAGLTSFLTMSYILAVNPSIFSALDGMPKGAVFTTTALVAIVGTLIMAFIAKKPFGIAPGMGSNAFFVFTICIGLGYPWRFALTAVFIEGIILFLLTRYVSLGSVWAGACFPFVTWFCYPEPVIVVLGFLCGGLVVWKHRANIKRLIQGNESKFSLHKKR